MQPQSRSFAVNDYRLAGLEWQAQSANSTKLLMLHGWLDNAASFARMAPLLAAQCHCLALDLPGHGHSEHKARHASYNLWDDLGDILAVADAMRWQRFTLLGHSRGALMAFLLAAAMPERIERVVFLDGFYPLPVAPEEAPQQLARHLQSMRDTAQRELPGYTSVDAAVAVRARRGGISVDAARSIVLRGLIERGGHFYWRNDPRLAAASAFKLSEQHNSAFCRALSAPALLLLAEQGLYPRYQPALEQLTALPALEFQLLPGQHHFHLEPDTAAAVAAAVAAFISPPQ